RAERLRHAMAADRDLRLRHHAVLGRPDQTHHGRHPDADLAGQVTSREKDAGRRREPAAPHPPSPTAPIARGNQMPVYEYLCNDCGPFTDMRPMAECDDPQDCPRCESEAPRVILTAPAFFCMPSDKRRAIATNERSANAPKTLGEYKATHGPG